MRDSDRRFKKEKRKMSSSTPARESFGLSPIIGEDVFFGVASDARSSINRSVDSPGVLNTGMLASPLPPTSVERIVIEQCAASTAMAYPDATQEIQQFYEVREQCVCV